MLCKLFLERLVLRALDAILTKTVLLTTKAMLSRRNLRVKVMQVIYSIEHNSQLEHAEAIHVLQRNVEKAYRLLYYTTALLVRIADNIKKEAELKTTKHLPTEADLHFSTRLAHNPFIHALRNNRKVQDQLRLQMTEEDTMLVKEFFKILSVKTEYKLYCAQENSIESERNILLLLHNLIVKTASYTQYAEDNFPECANELSKISFALEDILKKMPVEPSNNLFEFSNQKIEEDFAKELLIKTLENNERFTTLIQPKLKNWDIDRIARIDMVLMKMALCELIYFDQIPVKVSINEYIDISKVYSTPKSKDFINGILDGIMHELRESKEIKKSGRGLVE